MAGYRTENYFLIFHLTGLIIMTSAVRTYRSLRKKGKISVWSFVKILHVLLYLSKVEILIFNLFWLSNILNSPEQISSRRDLIIVWRAIIPSMQEAGPNFYLNVSLIKKYKMTIGNDAFQTPNLQLQHVFAVFLMSGNDVLSSNNDMIICRSANLLASAALVF